MSDASELITTEMVNEAFHAYSNAIWTGQINHEAMRAALTAAGLPAIIRQAREDERERAAKIADDVAARKNAAQTEAHEHSDDFAVGLFQASKYTARAIAAAIRRTEEPTP